MVNFEKLVESVLLLESLESESSANQFAAYFDSTGNPNLDGLKRELLNIFGMSNWPSSTELFPHIKQGYSKDGTSGTYKPFWQQFPIIDFCWYVVDDANKKTEALDPTANFKTTVDLETVCKNFTNELTSKHSVVDGHKLNPVCQYVPSSFAGMRDIVAVKKNNGCEPGEAGIKALENFIQNKYTLIQAIAHIADMKAPTRGIISRTAVIPIVDSNIRKAFTRSEMFVAGAPKAGVFASRGPKQIPEKLKTITGDEIIKMSNLIQAYANEDRPPVPKDSKPSPITEKELNVVLDTQVGQIKNKGTETSNEIIKWLTAQSSAEPGKKDYAGLATGAQQLASAAKAGGTFGTK
jgi:hypothetical protein